MGAENIGTSRTEQSACAMTVIIKDFTMGSHDLRYVLKGVRQRNLNSDQQRVNWLSLRKYGLSVLTFVRIVGSVS